MHSPAGTVKIIVRHSRTCPDASKGPAWQNCKCRKSLSVYHPEDRSTERIKTMERSWPAAEAFMKRYTDSFDPVLQRDLHELEERRAEDLIKSTPDQITIDQAIVQYIDNMRVRRLAEGTIANASSVFAYVDPQTKEITRSGNLLLWLHSQIVKPIFIGDLTLIHLDQWRATWTGQDTTCRGILEQTRRFFRFCKKRKWIKDNPALDMDPVKVRRGNRNAPFTTAQYNSIVKAVAKYKPDNVPGQREKVWQRRLLTFVKLLRHSGMDLADAVQFHPAEQMDGKWLRYARQKTGVDCAPIPLPDDLVALLRSVPDNYGLSGAPMPFRTTGLKLKDDTRKWAWRLEQVYKLAGITEVQTKLGTRTPHAKMFRHTFAVESLNAKVPLLAVSKMMGHGNIAITQRVYLPWCPSLEKMHVADVEKALATKKTKAPSKVVTMKTA
jgi:integrase